MLLTWFLLVALMLAAYVVLDGSTWSRHVHLLVARTEEERRQVRAASARCGRQRSLAAGRRWNAVFRLPTAVRSGFSGFYLPLMMVLWLLILRGSAWSCARTWIRVWRGIFDGCFGIGSLLLAVFYGAALGTWYGRPSAARRLLLSAAVDDWNVGPQPGILDWYTVLAE